MSERKRKSESERKKESPTPDAGRRADSGGFHLCADASLCEYVSTVLRILASSRPLRVQRGRTVNIVTLAPRRLDAAFSSLYLSTSTSWFSSGIRAARWLDRCGLCISSLPPMNSPGVDRLTSPCKSLPARGLVTGIRFSHSRM